MRRRQEKNSTHIHKFSKRISEGDDLLRHPDAVLLYFLCRFVNPEYGNKWGDLQTFL